MLTRVFLFKSTDLYKFQSHKYMDSQTLNVNYTILNCLFCIKNAIKNTSI